MELIDFLKSQLAIEKAKENEYKRFLTGLGHPEANKAAIKEIERQIAEIEAEDMI
jgi:NAD-dependent DNA ligase